MSENPHSVTPVQLGLDSYLFDVFTAIDEMQALHLVTLDKLHALQAYCQEFIQRQHITCAETIYQTDRVMENAMTFIEGICDIVGYHKEEEEVEND